MLNFAPIMIDLKGKYRKFREWQRQPYQVAEMSDEEHVCPTCATTYRGNYCPRCGQSCRIGRYSFKNAILLILDVWSFGNRSFFRTLRDLILRPGYMIRDYLMGMQMAYFPPFKLLFTLVAFMLLVSHGWNIKGQDRAVEQMQELNTTFDEKLVVNIPDAESYLEYVDSVQKQNTQQQIKRMNNTIDSVANKFLLSYERYMSFYTLFFLIVASGFFYMFFKKCPTIPDLRFSELLVALVYISNMLMLYSIICDFLCLPFIVEYSCQLFGVVALKQLTGLSWWRTILYTLLTFLLMFVSLSLVVAAVAIVAEAIR